MAQLPTKGRDLENAILWESSLPCNGCKFQSFCRYANTFKKINYDHNIFSLIIECNLKSTITQSETTLDCEVTVEKKKRII